MIEIVLATHNRDKIRELKELLESPDIKVLTLDDFPSFPEVVEDGKTLKENAVKKAGAVSRATGKLSVSDDSGLEVKILNGEPGVNSSRFAGEDCSYADNNRKLLKMMENVPENLRAARFKCVAALASPDGTVRTLEGICKGMISTEIRGNAGFGYDPVFIIPEYGATLAELGPEIKNKISHRSLAFRKVKKLLISLSG